MSFKFMGRISMYPRHVALLMAVAAVTFLQPIVTFADVRQRARKKREECQDWGCPLLPLDVHFDEAAKEALGSIRDLSREQVSSDSESAGSQESMMLLESSGDAETATLTLIGYKGGSMSSQINQDRAFVVSPFSIRGHSDETSSSGFDETKEARLLGVFDGHAPLGEKVSEYTVKRLPTLLSEKLNKAIEDDKTESEKDREAATKVALIETFVEMDQQVPGDPSGGCTASVVLQMGSKLYIANAGDSISYIMVYRKSSRSVQVVYKSREDKPHLPDERERVEAAGGRVYIPAKGGTSRVLYRDPTTGVQNGLAMSRSIGDWVVGRLGVIPDPVVDVIDIPQIVAAQLAHVASCVVIGETGEIQKDTCTAKELSTMQEMDDVYVFAVSATDGLTDYVTDDVIAHEVASSLFDENGPHPLTACEKLISLAANGWYQAKKGQYRDDISIAISKVRSP